MAKGKGKKKTGKKALRTQAKRTKRKAPQKHVRKQVRKALRVHNKRTTHTRAVKKTARKKSFHRAIRHHTPKHVKRIKTRPATPLTSILTTQRKLLRPHEDVAQAKAVIAFTAALAKAIPHAHITLGGSVAKGTSIRGVHDIDIFVRFPHDVQDAAMSAAVKDALPRAKIMHGSRDYFQIKQGAFMYEIVPVTYIEHPDQLRNVTDMSPLHVAYVRRTLTNGQKDDVRLAKQFCKAAGVYGAESFIKGFSGYALELLIGHYGSFERLLRVAAREWPVATDDTTSAIRNVNTTRNPPHKLVLDPARHYADAHAALLRLNEAKTLAPIVLIDPVDKTRNATAAISEQSYHTFIGAARTFVMHPTKNAFRVEVVVSAIKARWRDQHVLFVRATTPKGKADIVGCKVLAKHDEAIALLRKNDFPLVHAEWRFDEHTSICWYVLEKLRMPPHTEQQGPPTSIANAVEAFTAKHSRAFTRDGRYYAPVKRAQTDARKAIRTAWRPLRITVGK